MTAFFSKCIFLNENLSILIQISPKNVAQGAINNVSWFFYVIV